MFTSRFRRKRYPHLLRRFPLDTGGGSDSIYHLVAIWSRVRCTDFAHLPIEQRVGTVMELGVTSLPTLLAQLCTHNRYIGEQRDGALERLNANPVPVSPVSLDLFFSDPEHLAIDVGKHLIKLAAQIQILHSHVRGEEGAYYSRVSGYLYRDLTTLTTALCRLELTRHRSRRHP